MPHDVFISHSSLDKIAADTVCAVLESNGIRCWVAPRDILPSADWAESIVDALNECKIVVLVFSKNANESLPTRREIDRAISKGIPIIPFRIENIKPTGAMEFSISNVHWLDAFTPPLEAHTADLAQCVKAVLKRPGAVHPSAAPIPPVAAPPLPVRPPAEPAEPSSPTAAAPAAKVEPAPPPLPPDDSPVRKIGEAVSGAVREVFGQFFEKR